MKDVLLIAASGLAREVIAASHAEYNVAGILDDDESVHGSLHDGVPVLGGSELAASRSEYLLICVGAGSSRHAIASRLAALGVDGSRYETFISPGANVAPGSAVGQGSILLAGVVLTANVSVGRHVVVMPNVTLTHDNVIGDFVTIAAGVSLGGSVVLGCASYIGMNASVHQNVNIAPGATIGMGAAVLDDVPFGETWAGVPARSIVSGSRRSSVNEPS
ncbi:MAG: acetyltransferase [Cryobacterium sp.]|jgi:sugar O-acyltransferase (sialic acid O-acetyltransferase NeuD family)|nr:acetyltransferase [Cryobacterium sp.]